MPAKTMLRFVVMSDIHTKEKDCVELRRLEKGLREAYAYADGCAYPSIDAVFVVGDFTHHGTEAEMLDFKDVFYRNLRPETDVLLSAAGHEYSAGIPETHERMRRLFGMEPNMHKVIKGCHFISVAPDRGTHYGPAQQEYLFREVQKACDDDPAKAIFVFQHAHINNTVFGSYQWGEMDLIPVLMHFPQVIDFSGHSHCPINDPRNVHQGYFTCFGTGSLSYTEMDEFDKFYGTVPPEGDRFAQFLIVEVASDGAVRVRAYDIITGRFFPGDKVIRPPFTPENFAYTEEKRASAARPRFPENTPVSCRMEGNTAVVSFGQAMCGAERVKDYLVRVYRKTDGRIARSAAAWSGYYFYDLPERVTVDIRDLPPGDYTAVVTARSFWGRESENPLSADFRYEGSSADEKEEVSL